MARKKASTVFEKIPSNTTAEQAPAAQAPETTVEREAVATVNEVDKDKQISDLLKQISDLEAKIAEYIAELEPLRDVKSKLDDANAKLAEAAGKLKEATDKVNAKTAELEKLQADCDQYLLKISELTFENAKLAAAQKNCRPNIQRNSAANIFNGRSASGFSAPVQYSRSPNGYGTWN